VAQLASELGVLAFKQGFAQWSAADSSDEISLAERTRLALAELRAAARTMS
jgi:hypothetical protein